MQGYTKTGLFLLMIGIIIGIFANVILFLLSYTTSEDISGLLGIMGAALIAGTGGLLMLIGGILMILGRKELSEKHEKNMIKVLIIFVISIIFAVVISVVMVIIGLSGGTTDLAYYTFATTIISGVIGGFMYYFLLIELEDERGKYVLYVAIIASIVIAGIVSFYSTGQIGGLYDTTNADGTDISSAMSTVSNTGRLGIFSAVSALLLLYAVYIPYNRIKTGDLVPKIVDPLGQKSTTPERICPNCGKDIPMDANTCPYCGKQFQSFL